MELRCGAIAFLLLALASTCLAIRCPSPDWYYRKASNSCYFFALYGSTATTLTWNETIQECKVRGGKLATFTSAEELEWVRAKLALSRWYWFGLTYENLKWEWYDGDSYRPYTSIPTLDTVDPTGTDDYKRTQRASLYWNATSNRFGFDLETASSYNRNGYICKGDFSSKPWCSVEDGWTYSNGTCYRNNPDPETFDHAQTICGAHGGYVSVPNTGTEDDTIKSWLRTTLKVEKSWVGISIIPKNGSSSVDTVQWSDGSAIIGGVSIDKWIQKNLTSYISNMTDGQNYCGQLRSRPYSYGSGSSYFSYQSDLHVWSLENNCESEFPYICEAPLNKCPYGWRQLDDQCYQFNTGGDNLRTWSAARSDCQKLNADLVSVPSQKVQTFLEGVLQASGDWGTDQFFWVGLDSKPAADGGRAYGWVNGSVSLAADDYTNWHTAAQKEINDGNCAYLDGTLPQEPWGASTVLGKWKAARCTSKFNFICQAPYTADIQSDEIIHPDITCLAPFVKYHEGCYLTVPNLKLNRDAAQQYCQNQQNSVLAIARTFGEVQWLKGQVTVDSWIGVKIMTTQVVSGSTKYVYEYSDGTSFVDASSSYFEDTYLPTGDTFTRYCVAMAGINSQYNTTTYGNRPTRGKWFHAACTEERAFVCSHDGTPEPISPPHENNNDPSCGAGWFRNGDNCYRVHTNTAPWQLARQTCQNADPSADLLWITTKQESTYIKNYIERNQSVAAKDVELANNYWINFYADSASSSWYWPSRQNPAKKWHYPMAVTNWARGQPNITTVTSYRPRCAYIETDWLSAQWMAAPCTQNHAFICKKVLPFSLSVSSTTPSPTARPGQTLGCQKGFSNIAGRCVHFNLEQLTWTAARDNCRNLGGNLLSLHSETEMESIRHIPTGVWIGLNALTDTEYPRVYTWSDDSPMIYTPWSVQTHNSTMNCGALSGIDGFAMYSCYERKPSICTSSLTSGSNPPPSAIPISQSQGCKQWGWGFHERCFYFGQDPNTPDGLRPVNDFDAAQTFCKNRYNADLAIINTQDEQENINALLARFGSDYWIGLRESTAYSWNAFYYWTNNTYVSRTNWATLEPRTLANGIKRCVAIHGSHTETIVPGDWYVEDCTVPKFALCEGARAYHPDHPTYPTTPRPPTTPTTPPPVGCPTGWKTKSFSTLAAFPSCYKAYLGKTVGQIKKVTWQEAENFCRRFRNGHLATVDSASEQTFLASTLLNSYDKTDQTWIGLRQNGAQNKWEWVDGKPVTGTNFWSTTQDHQTDQPDCVAMEVYLGKWIPQNCQQGWGWICEIPRGIYTADELIENYPAAIEPNSTCGTSTSDGDWYYVNSTGECLYFSRKLEPWNSAQESCRAMGANLVTVANKTHDFISLKAQQFLPKPAQYWIGLYQTDPLIQEHQWIDGHVSLFRAWEAGEPSSFESTEIGGEECVTHNSWSGRWKDVNCGKNLNYICHKSDRRPNRPSRNETVGGACPADWVEHRGSCYYISGPENRTFAEADQLCSSTLTIALGLPRGYLASIHSPVENDFLVAQARRKHMTADERRMFDFWIGLRDYDDDNKLGWTDGSPLNYLNWHMKEPYLYQTNDCIAFGMDWTRAGRWSNVLCTSRRAFICKAPKNPDAPTVPPPATNCSAGYTQYGDNCFIVQKLDEGQKTWQNAQAKCQSLGDKFGDIATIVDSFENAEMRVLFNNQMHRIEGSERNATAWVGMQEHYGQFAWHNSCPVLFSNFANFYTKPQQNSSCMQMRHDGRWGEAPCEEEADYVLCERRFVPCPAVHNAQDDNLFCNDDFPHECNRTCYYIAMGTNYHDNSTQSTTIGQARAACTAKGGHLAAIRSEDDQQCLVGITKQSTQPLWIGLYEKKEGSGETAYSWVWETDETIHPPVTYKNWESGKPSIYPYSRDTCVQMQPTGEWKNVYCSSYSYGANAGYVCERRKEWKDRQRRTTTLPPATGSRTTPPSGDGPSGGTVAGIVIGVLLAVALVGGIAYVVLTGKTQNVLTSVRSAGTRVKTSASNRMGGAGSRWTGFTNTNYENGSDKVRVADDPDYHGQSDSYS